MSKRFSNDPQINKKNAIELLQKFIDTKLGGHREKLQTFSFWGIDNDKDFGNGLSYADGDRTKVAYAIDYLLFYDELKDIDFQIYGYSTKESTYSGETLNTFNTLFSSNEDGRTELASLYDSKYGLGAFKKYCYNSEGEVDNKDFYHVYQRLGNFSLLPCLTICGGSINTWKGMDASIRDYLYPFLIRLRKAYPLFRQRININ